jgi:hypothetical protein
MFSLLSNFFDFALLRQGQFLQRIGKVERFKKELDSIRSLPVYTKFYEFRYTGLVRDFIPKTLKARSRTILALTSLVSSQKQKPTIVKTVEPQQFLKAVIRGGNRRTFFVSLVDTR